MYDPWATDQNALQSLEITLFWGKMNIKIPTLAERKVSNKGRYYGTGDQK